MILRRLALCLATTALTTAFPAAAHSPDSLDPAHNAPLPCEFVSTPGMPPRSARNIQHVANVCGVVGTDIEFQSRTDAAGRVRDYAFLGTMGAGLRILDVTNPTRPVAAGAYADPGWQNDVQVRGDVAVIGFDPISGRPATGSACLLAKGAVGGVDIVRLTYDGGTGRFTTSLIDCVGNPPGGGAHNSTIHPSGRWLAFSNPRAHGSVDVIDLAGPTPVFRFRIVQDASLTNSVCTGLTPPARCIPNGRPGTWSPHDIHFSADGRTMYVAAVGNDTLIMDVGRALRGEVSIIAVIPNDRDGDGNVAGDPHDISISHQSDVTADGSLVAITDERGGGLQETRCNTDPNGVIGGLHVWALRPLRGVPESAGAAPSSPKRLGAWFYPNPLLTGDPLDRALEALPRTERGCTIHVFRLGGNGTASPGAVARGFDGVSRLPVRQLVSAHYGGGVWHIDISSASTDTDGTVEDARTTWGNTLGWNVMPGADTWSAKEYKGFIYTGDMARGFDVFRFATCQDTACTGS